MSSGYKRVLTGDRPTGRLHLGHYVGSLQNRVLLQNRSDIDECFYMVADVQALTDNYDNPTKVRSNVYEVVLDNLACGVSPEKTHMFIQSMVPEIAELTVFFLNLVTVNRLYQNPTVRSEIIQKGWKPPQLELGHNDQFSDSDVVDNHRGVPAGFLCYPVSQAADILFARANLIPAGADQRPMIEEANEIASAFNRIYGVDLFPHIDILVGNTPRLVGTDGNAKMSKSLGNTIYLADDIDTIQKKVTGMYTCPSKIHITDTVTDTELQGNTVFQYLDIFCEDQDRVSDIRTRYQRGETGDSEGKKLLVEVLHSMLGPIHTRRNEYAQHMDEVERYVKEGILHARMRAAETMTDVRRAMQIDY